jgi:hypothetical protein
VAKTKVLQIVIKDQRMVDWLNKAKKEMKAESDSQFGLSMLKYHMENDPADFKRKVETTRIETLLQEAIQREEEARKTREQLEKQKEKLNA